MTAPMRRWQWLPFFEAYFSNFIEGTEFGVDEARRIAVDGVPFAGRLEDGLDITATYRLAVNPADQVRVPTSGEELVRAHHSLQCSSSNNAGPAPSTGAPMTHRTRS